MHLRLSAFAATFAASLAAQSQTVVSPVQAATVEGTSNNVYPFGSNTPRRYQQVHSDIGGSVKTITKLSFRMNTGGTTNYTGTTALDTELLMGNSVDWNQVSFIYAANYLTPPSAVVARKIVNWGPQGQMTSPGPQPFVNMDIPLDTPFVYIGVANSLAWEAALHSYTVTGTYLGTMDAEGGTFTSGGSVSQGTGCVATGRGASMSHTVQAYDYAGTLVMSWIVTNGPSLAPTFVALGATNPNLTVSGLCAPVRTDLLAVLPMGATDATGAVTREMAPWISVANSFPGAQIFSQVHSVDVGRTDPIQISSSGGHATTVPTPNLSRIVKVTRIWNDFGGTTATRGAIATTSLDYGLVVQFTY